MNEALALSRQLGDQTSEEEALILSGVLAYWQGEYLRGNVCYEEAILLSERIGDDYQNLWAHVFMAYAVLQQGQLQRARTLFEDSLRRAQQAGITIAVVFALEGFARLLVRQEQFELVELPPGPMPCATRSAIIVRRLSRPRLSVI